MRDGLQESKEKQEYCLDEYESVLERAEGVEDRARQSGY